MIDLEKILGGTHIDREEPVNLLILNKAISNLEEGALRAYVQECDGQINSAANTRNLLVLDALIGRTKEHGVKGITGVYEMLKQGKPLAEITDHTAHLLSDLLTAEDREGIRQQADEWITREYQQREFDRVRAKARPWKVFRSRHIILLASVLTLAYAYAAKTWVFDRYKAHSELIQYARAEQAFVEHAKATSIDMAIAKAEAEHPRFNTYSNPADVNDTNMKILRSIHDDAKINLMIADFELRRDLVEAKISAYDRFLARQGLDDQSRIKAEYLRGILLYDTRGITRLGDDGMSTMTKAMAEGAGYSNIFDDSDLLELTERKYFRTISNPEAAAVSVYDYLFQLASDNPRTLIADHALNFCASMTHPEGLHIYNDELYDSNRTSRMTEKGIRQIKDENIAKRRREVLGMLRETTTQPQYHFLADYQLAMMDAPAVLEEGEPTKKLELIDRLVYVSSGLADKDIKFRPLVLVGRLYHSMKVHDKGNACLQFVIEHADHDTRKEAEKYLVAKGDIPKS